MAEVLTAIVTPFRGDGSLDIDRFERLARHLVDNGSDGLVVCGTTGESPTLSDDERMKLFAAAVDAVGERATVIAGTGTYSTAHSVHLTEQAHELGVDGFLVVYPYYNKPPARGFVEHVRAIAAASDKPLMIYNIPARTGVDISPETFVELAEIPTVRSVKQAHDDLGEARRIREETDLAVYAGDDALLLPFLELGGSGVVAVASHIVGHRLQELIAAFESGDRERAAEIDKELEPAWELLRVQVNPIPVKAALNLLGHAVGGHRLPLVAADDDERTAIRDCLERLGALTPTAAA